MNSTDGYECNMVLGMYCSGSAWTTADKQRTVGQRETRHGQIHWSQSASRLFTYLLACFLTPRFIDF